MAPTSFAFIPPLLVALVACGGTTSHTRLEAPETLLAEREEWRGERTGPVALRYHVEALVDTRPDPAKAQSALVVHLVVADFAGASPFKVAFPIPLGATLASAEVRLLAAAVDPVAGALVAPPTTTPGGLDPDQLTVSVTLPAPPADGLVEAILRFDVPGTFAGDARWLGLVGMPVGEMLLRYDLSTSTVGAFQTTLPNAHPVVTEKDGRRLIALLATRLPPIENARTALSARFAIVRASPKGYDQTFAADWAGATTGYRTRVVDASKGLDAGYEVPYRPVGSGRAQVLDALAWVRARTMRNDPFMARWDTARALPDPLAQNDLTAVDRTHLLHWVLREAGVAHGFLMARAYARPPLDPTFPTAGVFDAPLIYIADQELVLDPACDACAPGQVRPSLHGGQALLVPVTGDPKTATFITLPSPTP